MRPIAKFNFRGNWYTTDLVRKAACSAYSLPEADFQTDERLNELVDAIMKGPSTPCARFIVALNEGKVI